MTECIFCKIVLGEIPSSRIWESDSVLAFADINPATRGHTLVIPKQHSVNIFDMNEQDGASVMEAARQIAKVMPGALGCQGVNLFHCAGETAWQEVFHFHLHVIPRYSREELTPAWTLTPGDPAVIRDAADRLTRALPS